MTIARLQKITIRVLLVGAIVFGALFYLIGFGAQTPTEARLAFGMAKMLSGLIFFWILVGGALMYHFRELVRERVLAISLGWQLKFVLFCILLACLEEVVTVSMTNLAPFFGSKIGEAFITASTNYFDVIFLHSVIVFVPLFITLGYLLKKYAFTPFFTFMLFGFIGTVCEAIFAGNFGVFVMFPVWVFVYGLMVYLPTYSLPENRGAKPATIFNRILAVPALFVFSLPMIVPIVLVITQVLHHPSIDFGAK